MRKLWIVAALSLLALMPFQQDTAPQQQQAQNFNPFVYEANFIN
jgi:hypothetical protein